MTDRVDKDAMACNKPRRTPGHPKKSHIVKACYDGQEKIIRFGEQGASTAGKPKEGESDRMKTKRASFKARHAKNIAKGKSSAAYWSDKVKWADGGFVKMQRGGLPELPLPPIPPLTAVRARQAQEFDPVAAEIAEARRSVRRQPLPLPPIPPASAPPERAAGSAEAGTPPGFAGETAGDVIPSSLAQRLPPDSPWVAEAIKIAERYDLPRDVFLSLVAQESGFNPEARSSRGAYGLTQLMPGTARDLRVDPYDPAQNLEAGGRYLRMQLNRFGSLPLALAAYNAGPDRVMRAGNRVPEIAETQDYVAKIMRRAGIPGYAEGGSVGAEPLLDMEDRYADRPTVRADDDYERRLLARDPFAAPASRMGVSGVPVPRGGRAAFPGNAVSPFEAAMGLFPTMEDVQRGMMSGLIGVDIPEGGRVVQTDVTRSGYAIETADGRLIDPEGRQGRDVREFAGTTRRSAVLPVSRDVETGETSLGVPAALDVLPMAGMQGGPGGTLGAGRTRRPRRGGEGETPPRAPEVPPSESGDIVNPGAIEGLGTGRRGMAAVPNLRVLSAQDAARVAAGEPHLIRTPDGGYVGAPNWIKSPEDLAKMRADLDALIDEGGQFRGWYQNTRDFTSEIAGGDPIRERHISQGLGVTSPQASPDTNLNFLTQALTAYERGEPASIVRTGTTARAYNEGRDALRFDPASTYRDGERPMIGHNQPPIGERLIDEEIPSMRLGKKTGVYAQQIDPSAPYAPTGTNDTWMARAFGYRNADGDPGPYKGGVGPQQHAFMDYETVLAVQRANERKAGGASDWSAANIQEVPWVVLGGKLNAERLGIPYEEAVARMNRTYPDYAPNYSAYLPYEQVPGRSTGILPELLDPENAAAREQFSRIGSWRNARGNEGMAQDIGLMSRYTQSAPGIYRNTEGVLERNPAEVATVLVPNVELPYAGRGAAPRGVDPEAGKTLSGMQAVRGLIDAQEGSPWYYIQAPDPQRVGRGGGSQDNFRIDFGRQLTRSEADSLQAIAEREGLSFANSRNGAAFLNFDEMSNLQAGKLMKKLQAEIEEIKPDAVVYRGRRDGDYVDLSEEFSRANQGLGRATEKAFTYIDAMPGTSKERLLDSPTVRRKAEENLQRLIEFGGRGQRPDYERMLGIVSMSGLRGLRDYIIRNGPAGLPATLLATVGLEQAVGGEGSSRGRGRE